jgi:nicotinate-nucleotide adenylyltransferase
MIGFFGGSFDPIHYGHLKNAAQLKIELGLSALFLMPCAKPVHKDQLNFSTEQRMNMLQLAIKEFDTLAIDTREIEQDGVSYTIDSLKQIKSNYQNHLICLVIGMDSFNHLSSWKDSQDFYQYCHLVVINRPNISIVRQDYGFKLVDTINNLDDQKTGLLYFAKTQMLDISSSTIRGKIHDQQNLSGLLPESVITYIRTL